MWCIPKLDDEYIERMEDLLQLYERPLSRRKPVVCLDEKPVQLLKDARTPIEATKSGDIKKRDYEYRRCGTANIFCAVEPKRGKYLNEVTLRRRAPEFAQMIGKISASYRHAEKIHLVMDNLNTHSKKSVLSYYGPTRGKKLWKRFKIHFTPKHASWLNQAEIGIGILSRQVIGKDRVPDIRHLALRVERWTASRNQKEEPINWQFTRKKARKVFHYEN